MIQTLLQDASKALRGSHIDGLMEHRLRAVPYLARNLALIANAVSEMQPRHSRGVADVQLRFSRGAAEIQPGGLSAVLMAAGDRLAIVGIHLC